MDERRLKNLSFLISYFCFFLFNYFNCLRWETVELPSPFCYLKKKSQIFDFWSINEILDENRSKFLLSYILKKFETYLFQFKGWEAICTLLKNLKPTFLIFQKLILHVIIQHASREIAAYFLLTKHALYSIEFF